MYYDFTIDVPDAPGKLSTQKHGDITYLRYEYARDYDPKKQITYPKRVVIGKIAGNDNQFQPNDNFSKYFPNVELPIADTINKRSSCLRAGAYIVINKIIADYKLKEMLSEWFEDQDLGLLLDLAVYSIINEDNAGQYYPDYAYNHALLTDKMRVYSDSKVSDFLKSVTDDQTIGFINHWNSSRDHKEKIYISYDSTNKNSEAGDVTFVEYGHPKVDVGFPVFNYSVGYDITNREPLFYEKYPGSIVDVSQLNMMLEKARGYGYKNVGFILDRGYFSKANIEYLDKSGYEFVIMVKGMADLVSEIILKNRGTFENKRVCNIDGFGVYGITTKEMLYETDEKERYFHLFHSIQREASQRMKLEDDIKRMKIYMDSKKMEEVSFGAKFHKFFNLYFDKTGKKFLMYEEKIPEIEREINLCGYFTIITSEKMKAKEALRIYKSRDFSEKVFRGDKNYLGDKSLRTHSSESTSAKIFIEFVAMIIRNKIYTSLHDEMINIGKKPNYMTVPAAIKELEKIELTRQSDNVYRLDHAVTKTQKAILAAFNMTAQNIETQSKKISVVLKDNMYS